MIKSMTGFGRCEIQQDSKKFTVELKSVNHRYLDVNIRMPKKLNFFETSIRTLLKSYANRGKVDIFITYEDLSQAQSSVKYNPLIAAEYMKYFKQMEEEFGRTVLYLSHHQTKGACLILCFWKLKMFTVVTVTVTF